MTKDSNKHIPIFYCIMYVSVRDEFVQIVITNTKFKLRYYLNEKIFFTITHHIHNLILTKTSMTIIIIIIIQR